MTREHTPKPGAHWDTSVVPVERVVPDTTTDGHNEAAEPRNRRQRRDQARANRQERPAPMSDTPTVQGRCPACSRTCLILGAGGYVTCAHLECPDPAAASEVLEREPSEPGAAEFSAPRRRQPSRGVGPIGVGMPAALHLDAFGREIHAAFGWFPMLVGSSATSKTWRDVDVRLILPDDEFDRLFPEIPDHQGHAMWALMCAAFSELAKQRTGLPVDFQIQRMTDANKRYIEEHVRWAIGLHVAGGRG